MRVVDIPPLMIDSAGRFREDYGNIEDLADSIREKGLIQPITVQQTGDQSYKLVAGGRRLAAAVTLGMDSIPAVIREVEDEADYREIELFENVFRKNLTWQEEARLECEIYRLRGKSYRELADELDTTKSRLAMSVQLGEALKTLPDLAKKTTFDDAWKAYSAISEQLVVNELAKRAKVEETLSEAPPPVQPPGSPVESADMAAEGPQEVGGWQLAEPKPVGPKAAADAYLLQDALEGLEACSTYNFDFAEVDPPYGIDLKRAKHGGEGKGAEREAYVEVPSEDYGDFLYELATNVYACLKDDSFAVFWFAHQWYEVLLKTLKQAGFSAGPVPAIWAKPHGQTKQPDVNFASCYEPFFLARKGKPKLPKPGRSNIFNFEPTAPSSKIHLTQRPLPLMQELLDTCCLPGSKLLIPFLGSGNTLRAAWSRGMAGVGFDLDKTIRNKFLLQVKEDLEKDRYAYTTKYSTRSPTELVDR